MATDPEQEQPRLSFFGKTGKSFEEMNSSREPLLSVHHDSYSLPSAILPFLFPALGGLLYGYDIGATSGATISLQSAGLSGITWYNLSSVEVGLIVSGSLYGALIGSILAFSIADFLGRRRELIMSSLLYLVGALITSLAPNFPIMVIGRLVFGIGIGLAMHAAPMYIAETAPTQIRGRLISLKEFFIVLGMLLGYAVGSLEINIVSGWRYMYATSVPISLIMGAGIWWLPPSPRWLLLCAVQGKRNLQDTREIAIRCLCRLRGQAIGNSATEQIDEILADLSYSDEGKEASLLEVFQGKCLKALTIGGGLVLFQQITGQPSVLYYAATILKSAGFAAASDATRVSILLGLLKLIMTGIAVLIVDKLGRRPLLLGGVSGIVISLFALASYYTFLDNAPVLAVVALLLYVGCYQLSFGPIGWLMISEIFPLRLRGRGLSVAVLVNFASNAVVTFAFSPLQLLLQPSPGLLLLLVRLNSTTSVSRATRRRGKFVGVYLSLGRFSQTLLLPRRQLLRLLPSKESGKMKLLVTSLHIRTKLLWTSLPQLMTCLQRRVLVYLLVIKNWLPNEQRLALLLLVAACRPKLRPAYLGSSRKPWRRAKRLTLPRILTP